MGTGGVAGTGGGTSDGGRGSGGSAGRGGAPGTGGATGGGRATGGSGGIGGRVGTAGRAGVGGGGGIVSAGGSGGLGGTAGNAGTSGAGGAVMSGALFEQPEPWTKDVSALTKDARSDAIIAALIAMGGWGNGNVLQIDFAIPLFFATSSTPRQTITAPAARYCYGGTDCDPVPLQMPLPAGGNTEGSADYTCNTAKDDCHVLVVERNEKKLYELYNSTKTATGFTALVAIIWDLTRAYPANLRGDQCTSADAAGFPIAGLLPTADEVAAGEVNHALRFILPNPRMKADVYVHPGTHAGAPSSTDPNAPPYGVRFRLKAAFDETPYGAAERVILRALKRYGMLLSDGGEIALTFASDRTTAAKWQAQGITPQSFNSIGASNFEVVDLSPEIALTNDCVRNP
jgi:hypothetical protein